MKNFLLVLFTICFSVVVGCVSGCGGQTSSGKGQTITLRVVSVEKASVQIGVKLAQAGWFNLALAESADPIITTWTNSSDATVTFIQLQPQTSYTVHGMTFDETGKQTSDDWLVFETLPAPTNP